MLVSEKFYEIVIVQNFYLNEWNNLSFFFDLKYFFTTIQNYISS